MSQDYALSRVRDALEKSQGNHLKAQRLILSWLENDQTLLVGLVGPHLQSIVSHAVNHAAAPPKKKMPTHVELEDGHGTEFGAALLHGARGEAASFGEATPKGIGKPGKASQSHVDAINAIVQAGKKDDKKKK